MRGLLLALSVFGAFSIEAYQANEYESEAGLFESSEVEQARHKYISGAVGLDFEWLKALVRSSGATSVDEFLPHLPKNLRASYTLMKASGSLQQSSPMNPRAIVFAHDGSLILTFNGDKKQNGYQSLEVLEFSEADKEHRLFEVDFSRTGDARFSEPNPARCMNCHASWPKPKGAVKPIWAPYSHWLGAYGERDDHFVDVFSRRGGGDIGGVAERTEYDFRQWNEYQRFLKASENHPRYKYLIRKTEFSPAAPYILHSSAKFKDKSGEWIQRKVINMPNLRLSKILDANNARRVAAQITQHSEFESLAYRLLFQNLCQEEKEFSAAAWKMVELDDFGLSLNDLNIAFNENQMIYHNGSPSLKGSHVIVHKVFQRLMTLDPVLEDYYQQGGPLGYYSTFGFPPAEATRMKSLEFGERPESFQYSYVWAEVYAQLAPILDISSKKGLCGYLISKIESDESFKKTPLVPFFAVPARVQMQQSRTKTPQQILKSCADCHDSGMGFSTLATAPYYPFASEPALKQFLSRLKKYNQLDNFLRLVDGETQPDQTVVYSDESVTLTEAHRYQQIMPLGRQRLTDVERERLIEYLSSLGN